MHGDDVASEGAVQNWCDVAIGDAIGETSVWGRRHHCAWHAVDLGFLRAAEHGRTGRAIRNKARFIGMAVLSGTISHQFSVCAEHQENRMRYKKAWIRLEEQKAKMCLSPAGVGEVTEVGEPGTGISNAHRKPFTDRRTFWLSWGKF